MLGLHVQISTILTPIVSELWNMWEDVFQCLPTAAPHDQPRGERGAQEVQVLRLWKGIQIQASFEGKFNALLQTLVTGMFVFCRSTFVSTLETSHLSVTIVTRGLATQEATPLT